MSRDEAAQVLRSAFAGLNVMRDVADQIEPVEQIEQAIEDLFNGPEAAPQPTPIEISRTVFAVAEALVNITEDDNATDVMRRALGLYRTLVMHVKDGGRVVLTKGIEARTLKIRVKS